MKKQVEKDYSYLLRSAELRFPDLIEKAESWRGITREELLIQTVDGERYVYNDMRGSCRKLEEDLDEMDERRWREHFRKNLHRRLLEVPLTQGEIARRSGISEIMFSRYTTGKAVPSVYTLCKMAQVMGIDVIDLIEPDRRYHI